jgi:transcriptional regulator with XRE-family HTH domain
VVNCEHWIGGIELSSIGERIHYFRKLRGLTRKELADGFCEEGTLYLIEIKGQNPRLDLLLHLSHRLQIPLEYIVQSITIEETQYVNKVKHLCRELVYNKDYMALRFTIEEAENKLGANVRCKQTDLQKFLDWHKAIILVEEDQSFEDAVNILKKIIPQQLLSELDISIVNSLGLTLLDLQHIDESLTHFSNAYKAVQNLFALSDKTLYVRVSYNLAYTYTLQKQYLKAIDLCYSIFYYIESNHLQYMLGRTHHLLGTILFEMENYKEAETYLEKAAQIFLTKSNENYYIQTLLDITELYLEVGNIEKCKKLLLQCKQKMDIFNSPPYLYDAYNKVNELLSPKSRIE